MSKAAALYNTARWRKLRLAQLTDHPLCKFCLDTRARFTVATVADHVVPHRGDAHLFWEGALQSLCKSCHDSVKAELETTGRLRGCDVLGIPIDPNHPWRIATNAGG